MSNSWADEFDINIIADNVGKSIGQPIGQPTSQPIGPPIGQPLNDSQSPTTTPDSTILLATNYKPLSQSKMLTLQLQIINTIKLNQTAPQTIALLTKAIEIAKYLAELNKLPIINKQYNHVLMRSSYKFCEFNYECEFNYSSRKKICYAQHFVHNSVYNDLLCLKNYLEIDTDKINVSEISKSVNTLIFVINHMVNEISLVEFYKK